MEEAKYFQSISEVAKKLDLPSYILRFWEKQFPTFIKPTTGAGGRRYYRAADVAMIERIKDLLYKQGYTIKGVKKLLASGGGAAVADVANSAVSSDAVGAAISRAVDTIPEVVAGDLNQALELFIKAQLILSNVSNEV